MATVAERVADLLRSKRPESLCDYCIAKLLDLKKRQQANQATNALEHSADFVRQVGECSVCHEDRMVIRARAT
jgi:hypothetical protein